MAFDPIALPPLTTNDLPGIGGRIKDRPEDFEVEEIPAYQPSGNGEFLFIWIEKRDMGAEYCIRQVARRLGIANSEVGSAGLKDRHAVTRQWISVPAHAESSLSQLEGDGIRVLNVSRHENKLKTGHLHGNRFRILVRDVHDETSARLPPLVERIRQNGFPNYYGLQRFGREGETLRLGLKLLHGDKGAGRLSPFLRKLALSSAQSALFNEYLGRRLSDGLLWRVLPGDVMAKYPFGGMFVARDVAAEQARFDAREIVSAGPIFGRKTFAADGEAKDREAIVLADAGLSSSSFVSFGKLLQGTRRHNLVFLSDLAAEIEPDGVRLSFTLPAGSYATVLLEELTKERSALCDVASMDDVDKGFMD